MFTILFSIFNQDNKNRSKQYIAIFQQTYNIGIDIYRAFNLMCAIACAHELIFACVKFRAQTDISL